MTVSVKHAHQSAIADDPTKDVSSGEWNAEHTVSGLAAYEAGCDQGTTFPGSPVSGQMYYRTDRKVVYRYEDSVWNPERSYGAMTLYVDPTGTDDSSHGFASGTDAFLTINYALSQVPAIYGGDVVINVAAGTYTENVVVGGKSPSGPYTLTIQGTLTTTVSDTMTSGVQGTYNSSTQASVTKTSAGWTTDAYKNKLCKFTSGSNDGQYRIIETNSSTTLTLVGQKLPAAPAASDTFSIMSFGTVVSGTFAIYCGCVVLNISVTGTTTFYGGPVSCTRCSFTNVRAAGSTSIIGGLNTCVVNAASGTAIDVTVAIGIWTMHSCYVQAVSGNIALLVRQTVSCALMSCIMDGGSAATSNGIILCRGVTEVGLNGSTDLKLILKNSTGTGILANYGGVFYGKASATAFSSVSTQSSADATTYSAVV